MAKVLLTGMSGTGKSTVLNELNTRGHQTLDTDYGAWTLPNGLWDEPRMTELLAKNQQLIISGTVENQGQFYDRFDHIILLSAPLRVLLQRVSERTNNHYGKTSEQQSQIAAHKQSIEPILRRGATLELDSRRTITELANAIEKLLDR
ncbi:AAA family ATPase [Glutamicibacter sp.]|uniref:AAA family ATPase n=1 Tax=Glutamicibacter sp. TaxID=1931995 RepID=UPI0028BE0D8A|nr:AAA family ATPase [Glutamicibacter sp.]